MPSPIMHTLNRHICAYIPKAVVGERKEVGHFSYTVLREARPGLRQSDGDHAS